MQENIAYRFLKSGEEDCTLVGQINWLLMQLSGDSSITSSIDDEYLSVAVQVSRILTAWSGSKLVGMATLVPVIILTGLSGVIHDVVVDESNRGHGLGRELVVKLLDEAQSMGLQYVDLTSKPSRTTANNLYQSMGFERRETNVYRKKFEGGL
jgi:ribosomal protein S18 acetylase RimI-like enzyme